MHLVTHFAYPSNTQGDAVVHCSGANTPGQKHSVEMLGIAGNFALES